MATQKKTKKTSRSTATRAKTKSPVTKKKASVKAKAPKKLAKKATRKAAPKTKAPVKASRKTAKPGLLKAKRLATKKTAQKKAPRKHVAKQKPGEIQLELSLQAQPSEVFHALLDSSTFEGPSGEHAHISHCEGGKVKTYNGLIKGKILSLETDKKIVQSLRVEDWPVGVFSTATIELQQTPLGTRLELKQSGVPEYATDSMKQNWEELYWKPLRAVFSKTNESPSLSQSASESESPYNPSAPEER